LPTISNVALAYFGGGSEDGCHLERWLVEKRGVMERGKEGKELQSSIIEILERK
jgi:hypothetical protein